MKAVVLREEIPKTRKAACHICTAGGPTELPRDSEVDPRRGETLSQAHRTQGDWPKKPSEVRASREGTRDEDEARRENSSAKTGQGGDGGAEEDNVLQPLKR